MSDPTPAPRRSRKPRRPSPRTNYFARVYLFLDAPHPIACWRVRDERPDARGQLPLFPTAGRGER